MRRGPKFAMRAESIPAETGSHLRVNEGVDEDLESCGTRQRYLEGPVYFPGCSSGRDFSSLAAQCQSAFGHFWTRSSVQVTEFASKPWAPSAHAKQSLC